MIIIELIFFVILVLIIKFYLDNRRVSKYLSQLPKVKEHILIGSVLRFIGKNSQQIMEELTKMGNETELTCQLSVCTSPVIFIKDPESMQVVLNSPNCLQKPYFYKFLANPLSILSSEPKIWKVHRKLLNPAFNLKILLSFVNIFNEKSNLLVKNLEKFIDDPNPFDVSEFTFACTFDMVCGTTLGYNSMVQENKNSEFIESMHIFLDYSAQRITKLWIHPDFIFNRTHYGKEWNKCIGNIFKLVRFVKQSHVRDLTLGSSDNYESESFALNSNGDIEGSEPTDYGAPQIFIDQLFKIESKGLIDDECMIQQLCFLMMAGTDTSALVTAHSLVLLGIHQDIQERVVQELKEVYTSSDTHSNYETISKLNYLEMVIKEVMRLFPVAPFIARECNKDTEVTNYTIPNDSITLLSIYHLHRNPKIWGLNSNVFNPDNFLPEKVSKRHPYAYLPFSGGPRNCIGVRYVWISMKILLSAILRNYKITTDLTMEDLSTKFEITLKLVKRPMIKLQRRNFS